jgi:hypothetical protein
VTNGHAALFAVGIGSGAVQARRALDAHFVDVIVLRPGRP